MKVVTVGTKRPVNFSLGEYTGSVKEALEEMNGAGFATRLWDKDATLWKDDVMQCELIKDSLGWLSVPGPMRTKVEELTSFASEIKADGFTDVVVLGMGGSSLAPDLFAKTFTTPEGYPKLSVLDSTDPGTIAAITEKIDPAKTIFIVSSKSGSTIETMSFMEHFFALVSKDKGETAGENFVAITDEPSSLVALAEERKFRRVFINPGDIGGRYSALSYFGLVPAAIAGI